MLKILEKLFSKKLSREVFDRYIKNNKGYNLFIGEYRLTEEQLKEAFQNAINNGYKKQLLKHNLTFEQMEMLKPKVKRKLSHREQLNKIKLKMEK
jgi:hypothetical protein